MGGSGGCCFEAEDGIRDYDVTGVQTCALPISDERAPPEKAPPPEQTAAEKPDLKTVNPITRGIEAVSRFSGEFVAYWSVIAVFAYYYEVVARYIFNSPTNWAHEGMFLMFGMQYLMSGAYAYMSDSHVRVDVFYARFSPQTGRASCRERV